MADDALYRRIMSGEAGIWALPVRAALRAGSVLYGAGVALRNRRYDRCGPALTLDVPVISVGNLTVGGTGKTPFVVALVDRLGAMGLSPAVVARGYGGGVTGPNDEELLIRRRCPGVAYVSNADRVVAAEFAVREFGADVIVLDDGLQHRRLGRSLDVVLIDASCPFGYGHVLPRGLLREPVTALRRAGLVAITRCDHVSTQALECVRQRVIAISPDATVIECRHAVTGVDDLSGRALAGELAGKRAALFAAIGQPASFRHTVSALGIEVVGHRWWPDHHRYSHRDIDGLLHVDAFPPHDFLLTTEKDAVKLASFPAIDHASIGVVKIAIDFDGDGSTMLEHALKRVVAAS